MGREGEAVKAATGAKFSAALLQRCYFNWSAKLGTKYNFIFEIGSCDSLLHATRGFYSIVGGATRETRLSYSSPLVGGEEKSSFLANLGGLLRVVKEAVYNGREGKSGHRSEKRGKSCESSEAEGRDKNIVYDKYKLPIERFLKINSATM